MHSLIEPSGGGGGVQDPPDPNVASAPRDPQVPGAPEHIPLLVP